MNKKIWIPTIIVVLILAGATAYLFINLNKQKEENAAIKELAEIDKKEMENEYQQFAQQYSEMKTQTTTPSWHNLPLSKKKRNDYSTNCEE